MRKAIATSIATMALLALGATSATAAEVNINVKQGSASAQPCGAVIYPNNSGGCLVRMQGTVTIGMAWPSFSFDLTDCAADLKVRVGYSGTAVLQDIDYSALPSSARPEDCDSFSDCEATNVKWGRVIGYTDGTTKLEIPNVCINDGYDQEYFSTSGTATLTADVLPNRPAVWGQTQIPLTAFAIPPADPANDPTSWTLQGTLANTPGGSYQSVYIQ